MPRHEHRCGTCEERFEVVRSMHEPAGPVPCPAGHDGARRLFSAVGRSSSTPAPVSTGAGGAGGCCGGGCGCR